MSAHTPGPWDYDGEVCGEIIAPSSHIGPHGFPCSQLVAVATERAELNSGNDAHPDRSDDEARANARLIAAAPELLAALEAAAALVRAARCHFPKSIQNSDRFQLENTNAAICAAIAKARGQS